MKVVTGSGDFICHTENEMEDIIRERELDDIWINGHNDYPCLAILINKENACVHYFHNDDGDMWQSVGHGDKKVIFVNNGERSEMPEDCIISLTEAIECAKQFFRAQNRPTCIEWREL